MNGRQPCQRAPLCNRCVDPSFVQKRRWSSPTQAGHHRLSDLARRGHRSQDTGPAADYFFFGVPRLQKPPTLWPVSCARSTLSTPASREGPPHVIPRANEQNPPHTATPIIDHRWHGCAGNGRLGRWLARAIPRPRQPSGRPSTRRAAVFGAPWAHVMAGRVQLWPQRGDPPVWPRASQGGAVRCGRGPPRLGAQERSGHSSGQARARPHVASEALGSRCVWRAASAAIWGPPAAPDALLRRVPQAPTPSSSPRGPPWCSIQGTTTRPRSVPRLPHLDSTRQLHGRTGLVAPPHALRQRVWACSVVGPCASCGTIPRGGARWLSPAVCRWKTLIGCRRG